MKVYVAWSRRGPSTLRRRDGLCAVVSPDGEAVLYVGRDASGPASQPGVRLDPHPLLEQYLREHEIPETDLQEIVGEINLVGGGARSEELVQRTLDVIVLAE